MVKLDVCHSLGFFCGLNVLFSLVVCQVVPWLLSLLFKMLKVSIVSNPYICSLNRLYLRPLSWDEDRESAVFCHCKYMVLLISNSN